MATELATFAAGCFWGVEARFARMPGVISATSGYTGGTTPDPTYRAVCTGQTGHAEAVLVEYDPDRVSYEALLAQFWAMHNPTTRDRQGPDVGSQYRSAIFTHGEAQQRAATAARADQETSNRWGRPVVTEIAPATRFYPAEEYHQRYYQKHGITEGCHA